MMTRIDETKPKNIGNHPEGDLAAVCIRIELDMKPQLNIVLESGLPY